MNDVTKLTKAVKKLFDKIANLVTKEELQNYAKKTDIPNKVSKKFVSFVVRTSKKKGISL